ncbi:mercury(II) reductase [Rhabdothermincola sediminis]|uniref:mercury(II) reductase n=1 Tax=Rhabdothermincola sediminis TaxID=2751370 RepID=UPI001AA03E07|nr:mercury(II) reductase [Rhabdothermincola sediminis]
MAERFDLIAVGSGGAAFAAAIRAHDLGASVAIVERATVGGTCVNVGCVPSKALLAAADAVWHARHPRFAGVPATSGGVDLAAIQAQKRHLVGELRQGKYVNLAADYGFEIVVGEARFTDERTIDVDGRTLTAKAFVIATGAEPAFPDLVGIGDVDVLTSTSAMELNEVPEHLVIVGGGFVGLEQGQLFAHLGAKVTIIGRVAPHAEPELAQRLAEALTDEGLTLIAERATTVDRDGSGVRVTTAAGTTITGSHLLVATGRRPRTAALDLAVAGVETDAAGFIKTDNQQRSTNPVVYAAGDVTGGPQFVYVASAQGAAAAENALTRGEQRVDLTGLPDVIFTNPQLAAAGLTEAQAQASGFQTDSRVLELDRVPRALVSQDTRGAVKLVAEAGSGRILGVHLLAAGAGDVILAGVYAITQGMTVTDLASTWTPYLTMGEALRLAAQSYTQDVRKLSCCA